MTILDLLAQKAPEINKEMEEIIPRDEKPEDIYPLIWDFLDRGGKRFRPVLTLLSCEAVGGDPKKIKKAAVAFELFHNFCLTKDTIVATNPDGMKSITELRPGDTVYSFSEKTRSITKHPVLKVIELGPCKVFEVKTRNRTITSTINHPFLVVRKIHPLKISLTEEGRSSIKKALKTNNISFLKLSKKLNFCSSARNWPSTPNCLINFKEFEILQKSLKIKLKKDKDFIIRRSKTATEPVFEWKKVYELKKGDLIVISTGLPEEGKELKIPKHKKTKTILAKDNILIPNSTTEEVCQIVGMFLGNGNVSISNKSPNIHFYIPKSAHIRCAYENLFRRVFKKEPLGNKNAIYYSSSGLAYLFNYLDVNKKALNKRIPKWVFCLPPTHKLRFLRGLLDANGTVKKNRTIIFSSASKGLIKDTKLLLDSLGFTSRHIKYKIVQNLFSNAIKKQSIIWELEVANPTKVLIEIGSEDERHLKRFSRKTERGDLFQHKRTVHHNGIDLRYFGLNPVVSVKEKGEEPVYDIMVQGSHNFIANGIVAHNTLIHDDIEDDSLKRRGKPCLHITHGIPLAINAGDGLFVYVWKAVEDAHLPQEKLQRAMSIYNKAFKRVLDGQGWEIGWFTNNVWDLTEEDYLKMVKGKTGALIAGSCELGAYLGGGTEKQISALRNFGLAVGVAFQIQDDILDIIGDSKKFQKVLRGDVTEGKRTLLVIHTIENCTPEERNFLTSTLDEHTRDEEKINKVVDLFNKYGAIEYAKQFAKKMVGKEKTNLEKTLPDSEAKDNLLAMADFFINREF